MGEHKKNAVTNCPLAMFSEEKASYECGKIGCHLHLIENVAFHTLVKSDC